MSDQDQEKAIQGSAVEEVAPIAKPQPGATLKLFGSMMRTMGMTDGQIRTIAGKDVGDVLMKIRDGDLP